MYMKIPIKLDVYIEYTNPNNKRFSETFAALIENRFTERHYKEKLIELVKEVAEDVKKNLKV